MYRFSGIGYFLGHSLLGGYLYLHRVETVSTFSDAMIARVPFDASPLSNVARHCIPAAITAHGNVRKLNCSYVAFPDAFKGTAIVG